LTAAQDLPEHDRRTTSALHDHSARPRHHWLSPMSMALRLAAVGAFLVGVATAQADSDIVRQWSDGPLPVLQYRMASGKQYCSMMIPSGEDVLGLAKYDDGTVALAFGVKGSHWKQSGQVTLAIDGSEYGTDMKVVADDILGNAIKAEGAGRDFLHALYNGYSLSVTAGTVQRTFPLTGTAVAIDVLNRCRDEITSMHGAPSAARTGRPNEAALSASRGITNVHGVVNGTTGVSFILDSGAATVSLPRSLAVRLAEEGTLSRGDFISYDTYVLADGRKVREPVYRLRSIAIAGRTATNVLCSITDDGSRPLLGQSFLKKFSGWSVDNARGVLVLN
jgi:predicted aspartyl protease